MSQLPLENEDFIDRVADRVASQMNGNGAVQQKHPLNTIEIRDFDGTQRFAVYFVDQKVKQVSYENTRSRTEARKVAKRCAKTLERGLTILFSKHFLPEE